MLAELTRSIVMTKTAIVVLLALSGLGNAAPADAAGGNYVFDGGSVRAQTEVRRALSASSFDWNLVPAQVTIHIGAGVSSRASRGHIWLDEDLLRSGRFAWAVVQDEYAHQVDFFLFDEAVRERLTRVLRAQTWCHGGERVRHADYGCERFASTLVWTYWPSRDNAYRPQSQRDESAAIAPAKFRALVASILPATRSVRP